MKKTNMTAVQWLLEELKQLDKKVRSYNTIDYIKKRQSIVKQAFLRPFPLIFKAK